MKPKHTTVFSFPMKSPDDAVCRQDMTAIDQLKLWMTYQTHWCEHKPSVTISVKEHEWMEVGSWVWDNFDTISGISFLPFSEHTYRQAPFTKIVVRKNTKKHSKQFHRKWIGHYFQTTKAQDYTIGAQELIRSSGDGGCEVVDL